MAKSSVYEVAALAGVSIATVSRTLNQPHRVSENTRARVMEAVRTLDYTPDFEAAARARHQNDRVAVIAPMTTYPGFISRLKGVALALQERDSELIVFQVDASKLNNPNYTKYIEALASSGRYDGFIIMSLPLGGQELSRLAETKFPVVLIETNDPRFPTVQVDHRHGAELATQHLIDRGHKKLGFVGFVPLQDYSLNAPLQREESFVETLKKNGLEIYPEFIVHTEYDIYATANALTQILSREDRPTAIFCAADINALGAIRAANNLGLRIPEDIAIVGFDDIDMAQYMELTTIHQPLENSGREAVQLITKIIKNPTLSPAQEILLDLHLIVRGSS